jgi:predicted HicB family RNase H-like nuclease
MAMKHAVTFFEVESGPLEYQRHQSFPLRLPPSIWSQIRLLAGREGISLNQFISEAVGEKMVRLKSSPDRN